MNINQFSAYWRIQLKDIRAFPFSWMSELLIFPVRLLIIYVVFSHIFRLSSTSLGYTLHEITTYYFVALLLGRFLGEAMTITYQVWDDIRSGNLNLHIIRPLDYEIHLFLKVLAVSLIKTGYMTLILAPFALLLNLKPAQPQHLFSFFVMAVLAFCITFLLQFNIGVLSFWLEKTLTLRDLIYNMTALLSGALIPLALFPPWLVMLGNWLPFQYIIYLPANAYLGKISYLDFGLWFLKGIGWIMIGLCISRWLFLLGIRRYISPGG